MDNYTEALYAPVDLQFATLDSLVRAWAQVQPERPLISFGPQLTTAHDLLQRAGFLAAQLQQWGIGPGDRIALWAQNSEAWVAWLLAAAWRGAAVAALHPTLQPDELHYALSRAQPKWLIADHYCRGRDLRSIAQGVLGVADGSLPRDNAFGLQGMYFMPGADGFAQLSDLYDNGLPVPVAQRDPTATAALVFTSGSSGQPKLVQLTHQALIANAHGTATLAGIRPDDRIASPLPLYHAGGLSSGLVLSLVTGALWCSQARFNADELLDTILLRQCTVVQGVPTMFKALLKKIPFQPLPGATLRLGFIGGARAPADLCRSIESAMGLQRMCVTYGQTEFGPSIALTTGSEPDVLNEGNVGTPIPGTTLRIVDADGRALPEGAVGEIQVRGPTMMQGYFNDPSATAQAIAEGGWLKTGDLGQVQDGCLYVLGRLKDMIIRGGENIAAGEIEEVLLQMPGIAEACAVPVFSEYWGETVCAVVQPEPGWQLDADAVCAHAEALLPRYKQPEYIVIWPSVPLLASGKVNRRQVKQQAADELSLPILT